jgi:hypothetical protein
MDNQKPHELDQALCVFCLKRHPDTKKEFDYTFTMKRGSRGGQKYQNIPCHQNCYEAFERETKTTHRLFSISIFAVTLGFICRVDFTNYISILIWLAATLFVGLGMTYLITAFSFEDKYKKWKETSERLNLKS